MSNALSAALLVAPVGLGLVGFLVRRGSWDLTLEESFDHPERAIRWWHRFWSWSVCYLFAMIAALGLTGAVWAALDIEPATHPLLQLQLLVSLPLAFVFFAINRWRVARASPALRHARRRLGLPGYRVRPREDVPPPLHVAFATSPPAPASAGSTGTPTAVDLRDLELVREFARRHGEAMNFALAAGRGWRPRRHTAPASWRTSHACRTRTGSAHCDAYAREFATHMRTAAGIAASQRARMEEQSFLRARVARNARWLIGFVLVLAAAGSLLRACG